MNGDGMPLRKAGKQERKGRARVWGLPAPSQENGGGKERRGLRRLLLSYFPKRLLPLAVAVTICAAPTASADPKPFGTTTTVQSQMGAVEATSFYEQYRDFGGLRLASVVRQQAMALEQTITIETVEFDTVDPAVFELPPEIRALRSDADPRR